ncbi:MAG: hypothetical protein M1832_006460 [Thelocarpon impressellum]|nr:MAG: hypothetical protein M1832_006460 [Thelocarpon impressellum]
MDAQYINNPEGLTTDPSQQLHQLSGFPAPQAQQRPTGRPPHNLPALQQQQQQQHAALSFNQAVYGQPAVSQLAPRLVDGSHTMFSAQSRAAYPELAPHPSLSELQAQASLMASAGPFAAPTSMMPPVSGTLSHPQPIAPAPQGRAPVPLRPMPPVGLAQKLAETSASHFDQSPALSQIGEGVDPDAEPTHVVGSQGRRGILPSAPGRVTAAAAGSASANGKSALIPAKDADGKFPCPHCNKTYLHAKHLKRHLLRHTGDRPYMCVLCTDTFSRSDILKRHFQKCSLRRGNPTGASHLSHSHAHLKKSHPGPHKPSSAGVDEVEPTSAFDDSDPLAEGVAGHDPGSSTYTDESNPVSNAVSRRGSLKRRSSGGGRDRRSMTGPGPSGSNRASIDGGQGEEAALALLASLDQPDQAMSMLQSRNPHQTPFPHNYDFTHHDPHAEADSNGNLLGSDSLGPARPNMAYFNGTPQGQNGEIDWAQLFHPGSQDGLLNPLFEPTLAPGQMPSKAEGQHGNGTFTPNAGIHQDGIFSGLYPATNLGGLGAFNGADGLPNWHVDLSMADPLQNRANQLVSFCFPDNTMPSQENAKAKAEVARCLTPENIKCFVELFTNFQGHWPMIHMPTFNFMEVYEGLLLAIICIGAVYSDKLSVGQARELTERAQSATRRTSPLYAAVKAESNGGQSMAFNHGAGLPSDVEQIQALTLLKILFTWHGSQAHRESARKGFKDIVSIVRKARYLEPVPAGEHGFSLLHQPNLAVEKCKASDFDWLAWVEQEKRSRVMSNIYLVDTALVIYFNMPPHLDSMEMRIPLPADDVAWDAQTASDCADALGLHGPGPQAKNVTGSRRMKQPDMRSAMQTLLHPTYDLQPCSTNVYSKFILIHAVHVEIWKVQKQVSQSGGGKGGGDGSMSSGKSTPLQQKDWITRASEETAQMRGGGGSPDANGSQAANAGQMLRAITCALKKWKRAWDADMTIQYPPAASSARRVGFGRDGVPFYWLACAFIRNSRAMDWQAAPDARLVQVLHLLKQVKQRVASDSAARGEMLGSVGDIDDSYGVDELTLDMKLWFRPINEQLDSPVQGVPGLPEVQM